MANVTVDFSKSVGTIKPMHSVNNGPAGARVRGTSNFDAFSAAGIPMARNHDASFYPGYGGEHTVDIHRIFKNFAADENNPASYVFAPTDEYVKNTFECGTKVFYRLGATIEHGYKYGTYPPADFAKWARICEHVIRHYTEGWADGFHYDIEYWEIWNEPDCRNADGSNPCWQGTDEQFVDLFTTSIRHLKECFPNLKIGGPAFCSIWSEPFIDLLLTDMQKQKLPLDFFSYHGYAKDPDYYALSARMAREKLDKFGYTDTEIILNEWNYIKGWLNEDWKYSLRMEKGLKGAAFIASSMICAQHSPMDHFMYYDARPCGMNGMFNTDTLEPLKGYYPFPMYNVLYQLSNETEAVSDTEGVYALAAMNGREAAVMLSYYQDDDDAEPALANLSISGLPEGPWRFECYLLDAEHDNELVSRNSFISTGIDASLTLPLFTTCLLKISKVG